MTTVYFVRHAEPNHANRDDRSRELTEKGFRDRVLVNSFFREIPVDVMLSSPFRRSVDTIKPLADEKGLSIELMESFRERKVDSVWIEDFHAFSEAQWADFNYKLSDGECLREVQDRNIEALETVLSSYKEQTVVIGSHGTALSTIINYYDKSYGFSDFTRIRKIMPWIVKFEFDDKTCVSIAEYDLFSNTQTKRSV